MRLFDPSFLLMRSSQVFAAVLSLGLSLSQTAAAAEHQEARLKDFATVLARTTPVETSGELPDEQWQLVKLYAIHGSKLYDHLLARRGTTIAGKAFDVVDYS